MSLFVTGLLVAEALRVARRSALTECLSRFDQFMFSWTNVLPMIGPAFRRILWRGLRPLGGLPLIVFPLGGVVGFHLSVVCVSLVCSFAALVTVLMARYQLSRVPVRRVGSVEIVDLVLFVGLVFTAFFAWQWPNPLAGASFGLFTAMSGWVSWLVLKRTGSGAISVGTRTIPVGLAFSLLTLVVGEACGFAATLLFIDGGFPVDCVARFLVAMIIVAACANSSVSAVSRAAPPRTETKIPSTRKFCRR